MVDASELAALADAYAFLGNSLLRPMTQTSDVGLDPAFWHAFPDFGSSEVRRAADDLAVFAEAAQARIDGGEDMRECVAVEYTKLFIGPPRPAAAPWETFYASEGVTVGFGSATFAMRELLRSAGFELHNENHQYEDHMGIELLLLSELCRARAEGRTTAIDYAAFASEHPGSWAHKLAAAIDEAAPDGYFARLMTLVRTLLSITVS